MFKLAHRTRSLELLLPSCRLQILLLCDGSDFFKSSVEFLIKTNKLGREDEQDTERERRQDKWQKKGYIKGSTNQYLLTYSMVQSPSWEANWFTASQDIPRISRNPKVHYRTHNRPPTVSILGQPNPVHMPTFHLLEIHPNIINPSTPRSPQWSLSLRFLQKDPIPPFPHPNAPYAQPISFFSILSPAQY